MLTNANEFNSVGGGFPGGFGGGFGGFGGGIGGLGLVGLVGLNSFLGRDGERGGGCANDDNCAREAAILSAIANSKDTTVAEGRALAAAICATESSVKDGNYAAAIQAERNTAQLAAQAQAFAIAATAQFNEVKEAGVTQTAAILARINEVETQNLRDQLFEIRRGRDLDGIRIENNNTNTNIQAQFQAQAQLQLQAQLDEHRRRWDARENEINIVNTNTNINAQAQQQQQQQAIRDLDREHRWNQRFDTLLSQSNKVAQDIVNIGAGTVTGTQTSTPTNNTVNK